MSRFVVHYRIFASSFDKAAEAIVAMRKALAAS